MSSLNRQMRRAAEKSEGVRMLSDLHNAVNELGVRVARLEFFAAPEGPLHAIINQILGALISAKIIQIQAESPGGVDLSAAPSLKEAKPIVLATARGQPVGDRPAVPEPQTDQGQPDRPSGT